MRRSTAGIIQALAMSAFSFMPRRRRSTQRARYLIASGIPVDTQKRKSRRQMAQASRRAQLRKGNYRKVKA